MGTLRLEGLSKTYAGRSGAVAALHEVTLEVPAGQFLVVIGLSGSGKSTLLRCINRLIEPTAGRVLFDETDVTALAPRALRAYRARVGMIFQQFNLVPRKTVLANVLTGALGRVGPGALVERFAPALREEALSHLERVGIVDKAYEPARELSGGQQQRVAIARALMQNPALILADEPVASLDPATAHTVLDDLRDINERDGVTVLCNLHFLSLARTYGQRVIALKDGRVV